MAHLPYVKDMNARIADPALKREISHVLARGFYLLRFPTYIEKHFRENYRGIAIANLRGNSIFVGFIYLLAGAIATSQYDWRNAGVFAECYGVAGICLALVMLLTRIPSMDRYFHYYTGFIATTGLAAVMNIPITVQDPELRAAAYGLCVHATIIVYTMSKMRLYNSIIWCNLSGVIHLIALHMQGLSPHAIAFQTYYIAANLVGMGIAYIIEHRERAMFLQSLLLDIDNKERDLLLRDLQKLSREDALTGLANRRHFDECLAREWNRCRREKKPLSLVLVDVDFFKQYNDLYGHQAGDHCLTEVARALRKETSRPGELVGRYGGEEFVLLFPNIDDKQITISLSRLRERIQGLGIPHEGSRVATVVTASIGAATTIPHKSMHPDKLVSRADEMLYRAKSGGRNRWYQDLLEPPLYPDKVVEFQRAE